MRNKYGRTSLYVKSLFLYLISYMNNRSLMHNFTMHQDSSYFKVIIITIIRMKNLPYITIFMIKRGAQGMMV